LTGNNWYAEWSNSESIVGQWCNRAGYELEFAKKQGFKLNWKTYICDKHEWFF